VGTFPIQITLFIPFHNGEDAVFAAETVTQPSGPIFAKQALSGTHAKTVARHPCWHPPLPVSQLAIGQIPCYPPYPAKLYNLPTPHSFLFFFLSFSSSYLPCDRLGRSLISETRRTPSSLHTEGRASAKGLRAFWVAQFLIYLIDFYLFYHILILLILIILLRWSLGFVEALKERSIHGWGFGLLKEGSAL